MNGQLITVEDVVGVPAGVYEVASGTAAYFPAMGLIEDGVATYQGEAYRDGARVVRLALGVDRGLGAPEERRISISAAFFSTALKDYDNWPVKWWREAIQNSVDAGAHNINISATVQADGTWLLIIDDDGVGMDREVLVDKFLMLGATTKVGQDGAAGGFGKAKELLLLPWIGWRIHTKFSIAEGSGIDYSLSDAPHRIGTRLEVVMPPDNTTTDAKAIYFIEHCFLPHVRFTVNGKLVRADFQADRLVAQGAGVDVFFAEGTAMEYHCYVRTRGLLMFTKYVSSVKGRLIAELTKPSIDVLTANRDGFRDYGVARTIDALAERIAKDTTSALRKKQGLIEEKFKGKGKFRAKKIESAMLAQLGPVETELAAGDVQRLMHIMAEVTDEEGHTRGGPAKALPMTSTTSLAAIMLDQHFRGPNHIQAAIAQLVWEPDFYLKNEIEGFRVPKKFYPATMAARVKKLAKVWTELCRFVMMQLGSTQPFGVGFIFSGSAGAEAITEEDADGEAEQWLMLNPLRNWKTRDTKSIWSPTTDTHLQWLYAAAIHEATHIADKISYHDESFASALTLNMARCANGWRKVKAIVTNTRVEGQVEVEAEGDED